VGVPRLGSAKVTVSICDADGFRVEHADGSVLLQISADQLDTDDWEKFWSGILAVQNAVCRRQFEKTG